MSERAASLARGTRVVAAIALVWIAPARTAPSEGPAQELPTIRGQVVRDTDGSPVEGALVEAYPAFRAREETRTDEHGDFRRVGTPAFVHTNATSNSPYDSVQYLTVSAPGLARTLVDPCSDAPWAAPIRMRPTATLRGRVDGAPKSQRNHVVVIAPWRDLCWPPRTGLTRTDLRWLCDLDSEGRFEIRDVPG